VFDTWLVPMVHGDRFILCSDGLVDEVHDDEIAAIALGAADPQVCAEQLVAKANTNADATNQPSLSSTFCKSRTNCRGCRARVRAGVARVRLGRHDDRCRRQQRVERGCIIANPGVPVPDRARCRRRHRRTARAGQLGEASLPQTDRWAGGAVLTIVVTLIAVAVHNGSSGEPDTGNDDCRRHRAEYNCSPIDNERHVQRQPPHPPRRPRPRPRHDDREYEYIGP